MPRKRLPELHQTRWRNLPNHRHASKERKERCSKESHRFRRSTYCPTLFLLREKPRRAPLRVCGQELVSGSATLGAAIDHVVPAFYKGEKIFFSVSHLTPDYQFCAPLRGRPLRAGNYRTAEAGGGNSAPDPLFGEPSQRDRRPARFTIVGTLKGQRTASRRSTKISCRSPSVRRKTFIRRCSRSGFSFPLCGCAETGRASVGWTFYWGTT